MPISTPSDPQAAALLSHVLSQMHQNISFLASQNYISSVEATELLNRLTQIHSAPDSLVSGMDNLSVVPHHGLEPARRTVPPPPPRSANNVQKATALWGYNEDGREPNDLSFSAGEVVEIVDETNADWWTGKCRGKQGLFPSNHVQKLDRPSTASPPAPVSMPMAPSYYAPPSGPPQPYGMAPPPNEKMYQSSYVPTPMQAPPPPAPVVTQPTEPKKNKFGKLGSTMANSAAGGVGFGAGAAIGGGIIHAIF